MRRQHTETKLSLVTTSSPAPVQHWRLNSCPRMRPLAVFGAVLAAPTAAAAGGAPVPVHYLTYALKFWGINELSAVDTQHLPLTTQK